MKTWILPACLLLSTLLLGGCSDVEEKDSPAPSAPPPSAPVEETAPAQPLPILSSFTAQDLEGNEVTQDILSSFDLTMVNVWATFCGPCLQEMPDLGQLHTEYADQGFQVVGLVADVLKQDGTLDQAQIDTAIDIVEATQANYLHLLPTEDLLPIVAQAYAVPMSFFVDSQGNLVGSGAYMGARDKAGWSAIIDEMLAQAADDAS